LRTLRGRVGGPGGAPRSGRGRPGQPGRAHRDVELPPQWRGGRDRKHQGLRRGIPPLPHPWDGRFWVIWRAPRRSKSDAVPARVPHSRRPPPLQTHPSAPVTHPAALQALAITAARAGGPRAARSSPARTLPVSGPRTTARSSITRPQVGHAAPMTSKVRHSSVLQGTWRDRPEVSLRGRGW